MTEHTESPKPPDGGLRPGAVLTLLALMAAASLALMPALASDAPQGPIRLSLWMVIALTAATELAAVHRHGRQHTHTLSLSEITLVIGLAFAAPDDLLLGRAIAGLAVYGLYRRLPALKTGFNTIMFVLETTVAAVVYRAVLGTGSVTEPIGWLAAVAAIAAATAVGLMSVRAILAVHGEPLMDPGALATAFLSLAMTAVGTGIGILAVGALWLHAAAFAVVGIVAALLYAGLRTLVDAADLERQREALMGSLGEFGFRGELTGTLLTDLCAQLRVEHAEVMVISPAGCLRIESTGGRVDTASVGSDRCGLLLGTLDGTDALRGKGLPGDVGRELNSRGFSHPVAVPIHSNGAVCGYLAAGSKMTPQRRLTGVDRQTLELVARRMSRLGVQV